MSRISSNLLISLLKNESMLLYQRWPNKWRWRLLHCRFFAKETLTMGIVLDWLWCVHLINSKRFFNHYLSWNLRRKRRIKSDSSIKRSVFLVTQRTSWSRIGMNAIYCLVSHLLSNISTNRSTCQRVRFKAVCVQRVCR